MLHVHYTLHAIDVCLPSSYMYWTDWGEEPRIERAGMDGSNRYRRTDACPPPQPHEYTSSRVTKRAALFLSPKQEGHSGGGHLLAQRSDHRPAGAEVVLGRRQAQLHPQGQPGRIGTVRLLQCEFTQECVPVDTPPGKCVTSNK